MSGVKGYCGNTNTTASSAAGPVTSSVGSCSLGDSNGASQKSGAATSMDREAIKKKAAEVALTLQPYFDRFDPAKNGKFEDIDDDDDNDESDDDNESDDYDESDDDDNDDKARNNNGQYNDPEYRELVEQSRLLAEKVREERMRYCKDMERAEYYDQLNKNANEISSSLAQKPVSVKSDEDIEKDVGMWQKKVLQLQDVVDEQRRNLFEKNSTIANLENEAMERNVDYNIRVKSMEEEEEKKLENITNFLTSFKTANEHLGNQLELLSKRYLEKEYELKSTQRARLRLARSLQAAKDNVSDSFKDIEKLPEFMQTLQATLNSNMDELERLRTDVTDIAKRMDDVRSKNVDDGSNIKDLNQEVHELLNRFQDFILKFFRLDDTIVETCTNVQNSLALCEIPVPKLDKYFEDEDAQLLREIVEEKRNARAKSATSESVTTSSSFPAVMVLPDEKWKPRRREPERSGSVEYMSHPDHEQRGTGSVSRYNSTPRENAKTEEFDVMSVERLEQASVSSINLSLRTVPHAAPENKGTVPRNGGIEDTSRRYAPQFSPSRSRLSSHSESEDEGGDDGGGGSSNVYGDDRDSKQMSSYRIFGRNPRDMDLHTEFNILMKERDKIIKEYEQLKEDNEVMQEDITFLNDACDSLKAERAELLADLKAYQHQCKTADSALCDLERENTYLVKKLEDATSKYDEVSRANEMLKEELSQKNKDFEAKLAHFEENAQELMFKYEDLMQHSENMNKEKEQVFAQLQNYRSEMNKIKEENDLLKKDVTVKNQSSIQQLENMKREKEEILAQFQDYRSEMDKIQGENDLLKKHVMIKSQVLMQQFEDVKKEKKQKKQFVAQLQDYRSEIDKINEENDLLKKDVVVKNQVLMQQLEDVEKEKEQIITQFHDYRSEMDKIQGENDLLKKDVMVKNQVLMEQLEDVKKEKEHIVTQLQDYKSKIDKVQGENDLLKKDVMVKNQVLMQQLEEAKKENEHIVAQLQDYRTEMDKIQEENESLKKNVEASNQSQQKTETLLGQSSELSSKKLDLQISVEDSHPVSVVEVQRCTVECKEKLQTLTKTNTCLTSKLQKMEKEMRLAIEGKGKLKLCLNNICKRLEDIYSVRIGSVRGVQLKTPAIGTYIVVDSLEPVDEKVYLNMISLCRELEHIMKFDEQGVNELRAQLQETEAQLSQLQAMERVSPFNESEQFENPDFEEQTKSNGKRFNIEINNLEARLPFGSKKSASPNKALFEKRFDSNLTNGTLEEEISKLRYQISSLREENGSIRNNWRNVLMENRELRKIVENLKQRNEAKIKELYNMQQKLAQLPTTEQATKMIERNYAMRSEVDQLKEENEELRSYLEHLKYLQLQNGNSRNRVDNTHASPPFSDQTANAIQEKNAMLRELESLRAENAEFKNDIESLRLQNESKDVELGEALKKLLSLNFFPQDPDVTEEGSSRDDFQKLSEENRKLKKVVKSLKMQNDNKDKELGVLRSKQAEGSSHDCNECVKQLEEQVKFMSDTIEGLKVQKRNKQDELDAAQKKIDEIEKQFTHRYKCFAVITENHIKQLQGDNNYHMKLLELCEQLNNERDTFQVVYDELEDFLVTLTNDVGNVRYDMVDEIERLREKIRLLKHKEATYSAQVKQLIQSELSLPQKLRLGKRDACVETMILGDPEKEELRRKLMDLSTEKDELGFELQSLYDENESLISKVKLTDEEKRQILYETENTRLENQRMMVNVNMVMTENTNLKSTCNDLNKKIEQLMSHVNEAETEKLCLTLTLNKMNQMQAKLMDFLSHYTLITVSVDDGSVDDGSVEAHTKALTITLQDKKFERTFVLTPYFVLVSDFKAQTDCVKYNTVGITTEFPALPSTCVKYNTVGTTTEFPALPSTSDLSNDFEKNDNVPTLNIDIEGKDGLLLRTSTGPDVASNVRADTLPFETIDLAEGVNFGIGKEEIPRSSLQSETELAHMLQISNQKIDNLIRELSEVKNRESYKAYCNLRNKLDITLGELHQRDVRCGEVEHELVQLLRERDALQLRLSNVLRENENLKVWRGQDCSGQDGAKTQSVDLERKFQDLRNINYMKDPQLSEESKLRHEVQMQLLKDDPPEDTSSWISGNSPTLGGDGEGMLNEGAKEGDGGGLLPLGPIWKWFSGEGN